MRDKRTDSDTEWFESKRANTFLLYYPFSKKQVKADKPKDAAVLWVPFSLHHYLQNPQNNTVFAALFFIDR